MPSHLTFSSILPFFVTLCTNLHIPQNSGSLQQPAANISSSPIHIDHPLLPALSASNDWPPVPFVYLIPPESRRQTAMRFTITQYGARSPYSTHESMGKIVALSRKITEGGHPNEELGNYMVAIAGLTLELTATERAPWGMTRLQATSLLEAFGMKILKYHAVMGVQWGDIELIGLRGVITHVKILWTQ